MKNLSKIPVVLSLVLSVLLASGVASAQTTLVAEAVMKTVTVSSTQAFMDEQVNWLEQAKSDTACALNENVVSDVNKVIYGFKSELVVNRALIGHDSKILLAYADTLTRLQSSLTDIELAHGDLKCLYSSWLPELTQIANRAGGIRAATIFYNFSGN